MGIYIVQGGRKLEGEICVHGSKNAALPILAACLLTEKEIVLENCPLIADVRQTLEILRELGCRVSLDEKTRTLTLSCAALTKTEIGSEAVRKMRSSILFLGALLGRCRQAALAYPGGCAIGKRPIDLHLSAFEKMGVQIEERDCILHCQAPHILGYHLYLDFPSVGATENILLLAARAEGVTVIHNAAREPEIVALARFLRAMGAEIYGEGTSRIIIEGVKELHGAVFTIPGDRIEGGTFLCACAMTGGSLLLRGLEREQMGISLSMLQEIGCKFLWESSDLVWMQPPKRPKSNLSIVTGPFPAFPTDLQPIFMSLLTLADGTCMMMETVFEARFSQAQGLCRMGADIRISGQKAEIHGVERLHGAEVSAGDLRCGAALLLAAFAAEGESRVHGAEFVERGYEKIEKAFSLLGGKIQLSEGKGAKK